jgi:glycosyltransferase involved in cell wall biosynthesis
MSGLVGSVLIPAHNEAAVIARCLDHLFTGIDPDAIEVVVACNGCTDDTAAIARASGHPVKVLDLVDASKPAALRAGEAALTAFPRLYLDADVVLRGPDALAVLEHLAGPGALVARPAIRYDTAHSSAPVRRYYRARARVPNVMGAVWGAGVYGLSATGRARFGEYPDVVAEDLYVDRHFGPDEIAIVGGDPVGVVAPGTVRDLLKVMRRAYRGASHELEEAGAPADSTTGSTLGDVGRLARQGLPGLADAATYAGVAVAARVYVAVGRSTRWERDESSRAAV